MKLTQHISPAILTAATGLLQPFVPELSPGVLLEALRNYGESTSGNDSAPAKPLTRKEAAELLSVSLNTVNRYLNRGMLRRIPITARSIRIDSGSVKKMLEKSK